MKKTYIKVLTIAGSDSSGGAGIQADLKTFSALGCYGMSVITALTAQNTKGVSGIHPVPPEFVEKQMDAVFRDMGADAVKIGMLYSRDIIEVVAGCLTKYQARNIVLDPVMVSQSGDNLFRDDSLEALKRYLIPVSDIITPNLPEASVLLNRPFDESDIPRLMEELSGTGNINVLLKGGHSGGSSCDDVLYAGSEKKIYVLQGKRIDTKNNHGTGCTLSSAIACFLAKGLSLHAAVSKAKDFVTDAIKAGAGYEFGAGNGPLHHSFMYW